MTKISKNLNKQIRSWQIYSVIAPAVFVLVSGLLYVWYGIPFQSIFFSGVVILCITCIAWWHWSLFTMLTMLQIMKDTDDHFELVTEQLDDLRTTFGKPSLRLIKSVDKDQ
jgi:hypothetical protein